MFEYSKSISFAICGLILSILLLLIYLDKGKRTVIKKHYIYSLLLLIGINTLGLIYPFTIMNRDTMPLLNNIVCRSYIFLTFIFSYELSILVIVSIYNHINKLYYIIISILYILITAFISVFFKIFYTGGNGLSYSINGLAVNISLIMALLLFIIQIIFIYIKLKNKKKINIFPYIITLISYITTISLQGILHFYFNVSYIFYTAFLVCFYLTIESQDADVLDNLDKDCESMELKNNINEKLLSFVYHELRSELSIISNYYDLINASDKLDEDTVNETIKGINQSNFNINELIFNIDKISKYINKSIKMESKNYTMTSLVDSLKEIYDFNIVVDNNVPYELFGDKDLIVSLVRDITKSIVSISPEEKIQIRIGGSIERYIFNLFIIINSVNKPITNNMFNENININKLSTMAKNKIDLNIISANEIANIMNGEITFDDINGSKFTLKLNQKIINMTGRESDK